ncbi:hypothetical protein H2199_006763 [Coniosporium tulheliwenetii]|uniref:Uncharacterized protein n=1 Tax=Coniosporium tulheliwenetii TaxID=3383036 RepID=A0ACC2YU65_9PEZI|nr:hypothetical protein H2199_006763 [Cladosporium sp. JES 115]
MSAPYEKDPITPFALRDAAQYLGALQHMRPRHPGDRPSEVVANGVSSAISTVEAALIQHLREQAAEPLDDHETSEADTPDAADPERPYKTPKKRRHRYTREQKLAAIHYATTATKPGPDGTPQPIEGLEAAKHLNITWGMLRDWVANKTKIENMRPGSVKYRKGQTIHGGIQKVYRKRGPPEWDPQRGPRPLAPRDPSAPEVNDTPGGAQLKDFRTPVILYKTAKMFP